MSEQGLKLKYKLEKADGRPVDPDGVYFVLKLNSDNRAHQKASIAAARAYATVIRPAMPKLADDLVRLCDQIEAAVALNDYHVERG